MISLKFPGDVGLPTAGAMSFSTLSRRKNLEADSQNPNLYSSLEDLKDNRKIQENIYDEIKQRRLTLQRNRDSMQEASTSFGKIFVP